MSRALEAGFFTTEPPGKPIWVAQLVAGSSAGKESACNTGDSGWNPGSGRSPGEGIGFLLQ